VEDPIVRPNAPSDLFVHTHRFGAPQPLLVVLSGLAKLAVLRQLTRCGEFRLVDGLRINGTACSGSVMPLLNEGPAIIKDSIRVGRVRPHRHKDYRVGAVEAKIHALLQADAFTLAHLKVGYDFVVQVNASSISPAAGIGSPRSIRAASNNALA
jgi:hypothetical protein